MSTQSKAEQFNDWMRNKVKSIHYSNDDKMTKAYDIVEGRDTRVIESEDDETNS